MAQLPQEQRAPSEGSPDEGLLHEVAAGRAEALDRWFRLEHPSVYRLCLGFLGDPVEADDAAQDAMLKLHDRLESRDPHHAYSSWRNALVVNLCRDRFRRSETRRRHEREAAARRELTLPDPSAERELQEVQELLMRSLSSLSPREREVFVLRDLEGERTDEVARVLEISPSSVRSHLTLARRRLRALLGPVLSPMAGEEQL